MKRLTAILILLACFLGATSAQETMRYAVHHYSAQDGLPQNTVMAIMQDRDGFIWLGTWDGLCRFDGYQFKTYKPTYSGDRIASNRIDYLYEDALGFIWARTYDGGFYRLNKHTESILATNLHDVRFGNHRMQRQFLTEERPGIIWLSGDNQLVRIEEHPAGKLSEKTKKTSYTLHGSANFMICDSQGGIWAGTQNGLEQIVDGEQKTLYPGSNAEENHFTCAVAQGKQIWIGTNSGLVWRYNEDNHRFDRIRIPAKSAITAIQLFDNNHLLFLTEKDGFFCYDITGGTTRHYFSGNSKIGNDHFTQAYVDRHGDAWLVNEQNGVWRLDHTTNSVKLYQSEIDRRYASMQDEYFMAFEDAAGKLWINPQGGGFSCYDPQTDRLTSPLAGVCNMIHSAFVDAKGSIWLGTYDSGLDRIDIMPEEFVLTDLRTSAKSSGEVRAILPMKGQTLFATRDDNIHIFLSDWTCREVTKNQGRIYTMLRGTQNHLIMGAKGGGLWYPEMGGMFLHNEDDRYSLLSNNVYDLVFGPDSTLYIATYGGGINIFRGGRFIHEENDWTSYPGNFGAKVRNLCFVDDTTLWAATTDGLLRVNTITLETKETPYFDIRCIIRTPEGQVWLGTFGGGLVRVINPKVEDVLGEKNIVHYTKQNGLQSDIVLAMTHDAEGDIWLTSEEVISHFDQATGTFQHFKALAQTEKAWFSEAKAARLADTAIVFGYNHGFCRFCPKQILGSSTMPEIRFTDFLLFNKSAHVGGKGLLHDNICYAPQITLRHSESVFTIEYAALDYTSSEDIQYAYKMDGVDDDWNYVNHDRRATYTNLPAGDYTFRVRCTNAQGVWGTEDTTLQLHINRSFWATPWAWMLYLIVLAIIGGLIYRNFLTTTRLHQEVEIEQKVTDIKLRFFTNISHELRTPLTLISGPLENVLHNEQISPSVRTQLEIVSSNAARMLRLINQILDFRKIQNNKMRLQIQQTNLPKLVRETSGNFAKEAQDKHITFAVEAESENILAWVDRQKVDTIVYNLLSNALKFTPAGKSITVRVGQRNEYAVIEVIDTGVGIPKERRATLFQRFFSNNELAITDKPSTGIGLNLVKELVDLHHGYIEVASEVGKGTTFTVLLHPGKEHFNMDVDFVIEDSERPAIESNEEEPFSDNDEQKDPQLKTLLIVDDNDDMRVFLRSILSGDYNVLAAADGEEAQQIATNHAVDLILSDLMMPNVDGLELTNRIKSNINTSHIPVVLLTAKSAIESRLQALEYGADDYITKPFSPEYLLARVDNIIRQRERLQETFRMSMTMQAEPKSTPLNPNEIFLQKLQEFMMRNLDNNELSVEDLVHEMALGRTVFFNKLKGLTGLSPVEYIRDFRVKRAAELLLDQQYNITDVAYMVGMNDSRYFAKCFKNSYGVTPTEYIKQHRNA